MTVEQILAIIAALAGWPALVALIIDILKYIGVVQDDTAGRWNLGFHLVAFVLVGVIAGYYPDIDIYGLDKALLAWVNILAYVFTLVVQILATRGFHRLYVKTETGKKYFTFNSYQSEIA
jgi:hypothetical protein